jgi:hypothetical protein
LVWPCRRPDPAQGGRGPPGAGPSRRANPAGPRTRNRPTSARLSAREPGGAVRESIVVSTEIRFVARASCGDWPVTRLGGERVSERLTSGAFTLDTAGGRKRRRHGVSALLGWLAPNPGIPGRSGGWPAGQTARARRGGRSQRRGCARVAETLPSGSRRWGRRSPSRSAPMWYGLASPGS